MRRIVGVIAVVAMTSGLTAVGMVAAAPAGAAGGITCSTGSGTTKVSPGLTNTPTTQNVVSKGTLSGCSGTFTSAKTLSHLKSAAATCATAQAGSGTISGTEIIKWSPKGMGNSMANISITGTGPSTPAHISGTITSGPFAGMSISSNVMTTPVVKGGVTPCTSQKTAIKKATFALTSAFTVS